MSAGYASAHSKKKEAGTDSRGGECGALYREKPLWEQINAEASNVFIFVYVIFMN
jgi:hypothetical protein